MSKEQVARRRGYPSGPTNSNQLHFTVRSQYETPPARYGGRPWRWAQDGSRARRAALSRATWNTRLANILGSQREPGHDPVEVQPTGSGLPVRRDAGAAAGMRGR